MRSCLVSVIIHPLILVYTEDSLRVPEPVVRHPDIRQAIR